MFSVSLKSEKRIGGTEINEGAGNMTIHKIRGCEYIIVG